MLRLVCLFKNQNTRRRESLLQNSKALSLSAFQAKEHSSRERQRGVYRKVLVDIRSPRIASSQAKIEVTTQIQMPSLCGTIYILTVGDNHYLKLSAQHKPRESESFPSKFKSRIQILLQLAEQAEITDKNSNKAYHVFTVLRILRQFLP